MFGEDGEKKRKMVVDWEKSIFWGGNQMICLGLVKFEMSAGIQG